MNDNRYSTEQFNRLNEFLHGHSENRCIVFMDTSHVAKNVTLVEIVDTDTDTIVCLTAEGLCRASAELLD